MSSGVELKFWASVISLGGKLQSFLSIFMRESSDCFQQVLAITILSVRSSECHTGGSVNKKFERMLTRRVKAYSSSSSVVTHRSTNRAQPRVTSFQPKRITNYATPSTPEPWRRLVNDIDLRSRISRKKSIKPPILAFKVCLLYTSDAADE